MAGAGATAPAGGAAIAPGAPVPGVERKASNRAVIRPTAKEPSATQPGKERVVGGTADRGRRGNDDGSLTGTGASGPPAPPVGSPNSRRTTGGQSGIPMGAGGGGGGSDHAARAVAISNGL